MTKDQFRSWIFGLVEQWRTGTAGAPPVFYQNADLPDEDTVGAQWLDVSISFVDSHEFAVGGRPPVRDSGSVKLMLYTKRGEGTKASDTLLESLREHFRTNNRTADAVLRAPVPHEPPEALGWQKAGWLIPFHCNLQ